GDWLYGRFEIRAKMPRGLGTWPAIWMLPTDRVYGVWPASGEIDIMEHVGYDQGISHSSVHTKAFNHVMGTQKSARTRLSDISEEFHTYILTWLPDKLLIAVDGEVYFTYEPGRYAAQPTFREWPFDRRHHLLLNIAFGGNWGGARGIDENVLPQRMLVDYVRVYQSPEIAALVKGE
ncbi:MAG TPA: glycoside hydrolase family 16 protein, partial [Clostridia bacterium]|nr:glycoside hydrolase family 16 protein [Clostridia bacterium]